MLPKLFFVLGNGLDIAQRRVMPQQPVRLLAHLLGYGLAGGQLFQKRAGLQDVPGSLFWHGHARAASG